ncbi:MAG: sulfatase-like hydrolase/transferase [Planctomycetes bacterium]|nr:sulfatase-like hydrolase/transferase [Planctomycetota bacterium]
MRRRDRRQRAAELAAVLSMGLAAAGLTACGEGGANANGSGSASASGDPAAVSAPALAPLAGPAKSLLLVTLDTTRKDRLGCYGHAAARTPFLDDLARQGLTYDRAYCAAPITLSSHTSILTGVYPCAHGVRENGAFKVNDNARLLPEALREAGFRTGAFVGTFILDAKFGLDQGFEHYDQPDASKVGQTWKVTERPARAVTDAALRWVDTLAPGERWFLWLHFYDPHHPHEPDPADVYEGGEPYDAEIRGCDGQLARLTAHLAKRGLADGMVVAVTADHGESFHAHGEESHGIFVYEPTMRVPLIIAPPPPGVAPGSRSDALVSNVDLAATLLERLGVGRAALPDARTPPLPDGHGDEERAVYIESLTPFYDHRWHPLRGVVWKGMKFIDTRRPELYALQDDPGELDDLIEKRAEVAAALRARLEALLLEHAALPWEDAGVLSEEDREKITSLGYTHSSPGGDPWDPELPDAKDRIGDLDLIDTAIARVRDGAALLEIDGAKRAGESAEWIAQRREQGLKLMDEAKQLLLELRKRNPADPYIDVMLGSALMGLGQWGEAAVVLERVVAANPDNSANHYNLANAYLRSGKKSWGLREMEKSVHLDPRSVAAWRWLVEYSMKERDWPAAAWWLDGLAKCAGQNEADLAEVKKTRGDVQKQLDLLNAKPRAPKPLTDDELIPEGVRARRAEQGR